MFASLPPRTPHGFAAFAAGACVANILYAVVGSIVHSYGLSFSYWNFRVPSSLRSFHQVIREETSAKLRTVYAILAAALYMSFAWCLYWFVIFFTHPS